MKTKLNEKEMRVLKALIESSDGNGHDFGFTDDLDVSNLKLTSKQLPGYISQIVQKGLISHPRTAKEDGYHSESGQPCYNGMFEVTRKLLIEFPELFEDAEEIYHISINKSWEPIGKNPEPDDFSAKE